MANKGSLFRLALPMVVGQLAFASMSFIDTVLMGQLGVDYLAGGGLGAVAFQFFYISAVGVLAATANHIAFYKGRNQQESIHQSLLAGIVIVAILFCLFGLVIWNIKPIFLLFGQELAVSQIAESYLQTLVWALFPALIFVLYRSLVLGLGKPALVLPISIIAALLNYPISHTLMTGNFGFPEMGIQGVALGTCIVSLGMAFSIILFSYRRPVFRAYPFWSGWSLFSWAEFVATWRLGIPIAVAHAMEIGLFSAASFLIGLVSVEALAAHQVALQVTTLTFMIPLGISQAVSVRVGACYGAGDRAGVKQTVRKGLLAATISACVAGFVFISFPETLTLFFIDDDAASVAALLPVASSILFVAAMFQLVDGYQVVLMGALRGFKLGVAPTAAAIIAYWCIGFPLCYLLLEDFGAAGVWSAMGLGLGASALILSAIYIRFHQNWQGAS